MKHYLLIIKHLINIPLQILKIFLIFITILYFGIKSGLSQDVGGFDDPWIIPLYGNVKWKLVFEDDFLGTKLDSSKWAYYIHVDPNHGPSVYNLPDNVSLNSGTLSIITRKLPYPRRIYNWQYPQGIDVYFSSAYFHTKKNFDYGMATARIKIPSDVKGLNPAFWLFGNFPDDKWNEFDIFEFMHNNPKDLSITYHHSGCGQEHNMKSFRINDGTDHSAKFYIYSGAFFTMDSWVERDGAVIFYDYFTYDCAYPRTPMAIYLDNSVWNISNSTPTLPSIMEVDFVRFYAPIYLWDVLITNIYDGRNYDLIYNSSYFTIPSSKYRFSNTNYFCFAKSVTINSHLPLTSDSFIDVRAENYIQLDKGFEVSSNFSALIQPLLNEPQPITPIILSK
ncbi:MAG: glycoside hydrolase family 16 protein [Bacteroidales bacterium]|nr:glycoside hydrolase family 16 protein [Bacteroidales bacterium]